MALADVLAVMQDGEIRQIGTPGKFIGGPRSLYVAHFVGEANTLPGARLVHREPPRSSQKPISDAWRSTMSEPMPQRRKLEAMSSCGLRISGSLCDVPSGRRTIELNVFHGKVLSSVLLGPHVELQIAVGECGAARLDRFSPAERVCSSRSLVSL